MKRRLLLPLLCGLIPWCAAIGQTPSLVRVHGAVSVALPFSDAARVLRAEKNLDIRIMTTGGTPAGIASLGEGAVDIALSARPVSPQERAMAPSVVFNEIPLGGQAVALVVSRDAWDGGVRALTANQVRDIYEGKVTNWKEVGGPNLKITVFMTAPGRGMWEMFAQWLYGDVKKTPVKKYAIVNSPEEIRNAVEFTPGSFCQIPSPLADGKVLFPLAIRDENGTAFQPNVENYISGKYPLYRKLWMITNDRPTMINKIVVDFMLSERGQEFLKNNALLPIADVTPN